LLTRPPGTGAPADKPEENPGRGRGGRYRAFYSARWRRLEDRRRRMELGPCEPVLWFHDQHLQLRAFQRARRAVAVRTPARSRFAIDPLRSPRVGRVEGEPPPVRARGERRR